MVQMEEKEPEVMISLNLLEIYFQFEIGITRWICPGLCLIADEQLVAVKGLCPFQMYTHIYSKAGKYIYILI